MTGGGDTPLGKHWKYALDAANFLAGRISEDDPDTLMADIYAVMQGDNANCIVFNDDGTAVNIFYPTTQMLTQIKSAVEAHFNIELTQTSLATGVVNMGEQLPDWNTYELVS